MNNPLSIKTSIRRASTLTVTALLFACGTAQIQGGEDDRPNSKQVPPTEYDAIRIGIPRLTKGLDKDKVWKTLAIRKDAKFEFVVFHDGRYIGYYRLSPKCLLTVEFLLEGTALGLRYAELKEDERIVARFPPSK